MRLMNSKIEFHASMPVSPLGVYVDLVQSARGLSQKSRSDGHPVPYR